MYIYRYIKRNICFKEEMLSFPTSSLLTGAKLFFDLFRVTALLFPILNKSSPTFWPEIYILHLERALILFWKAVCQHTHLLGKSMLRSGAYCQGSQSLKYVLSYTRMLSGPGRNLHFCKYNIFFYIKSLIVPYLFSFLWIYRRPMTYILMYIWYTIILNDIRMIPNTVNVLFWWWKGARTHGMDWTLSCGDLRQKNNTFKINVFPLLHVVLLIFTAGPYNFFSYCWSGISYLRYNFGHMCLKTEFAFLVLMLMDFFWAMYVRQKTSSTVMFCCIFLLREH